MESKERLRSISECQLTTKAGKKMGTLRTSPRERRKSNEWKTNSRPPEDDVAKDSEILKKFVASYRFYGDVVLYKPCEHYGFIRSHNVEGDIFFGCRAMNFKIDRNNNSSLIDSKVSFIIENIGKNSIEARNVKLSSDDEVPQTLQGRIVSWGKKEGRIQIISRNRNISFICIPFSLSTISADITAVNVGSTVSLKLMLRKGFRPWATEISVLRKVNTKEKLVTTPNRRTIPTNITMQNKGKKSEETSTKNKENLVQPKAYENDTMVIKQVTSDELSLELIAEIARMDGSSLTDFFHNKLKIHLPSLVTQPVGSAVLVALIKRVRSVGAPKIEEKVTRIVMSNIINCCSTKHGCSVVQSCIENFCIENQRMLAEKIVELETIDELTELWSHGGHIFSLVINLLDEASLSHICSTLTGHFVSLAQDIRYYKCVRAILSKIAATDLFTDVIIECEGDFIELGCNKFGYSVASCLLENSTAPDNESLVDNFRGRVAFLAIHPICHKVLITALNFGSTGQVNSLIEEVCLVPEDKADMAVIELCKDKYGHAVILAMLKVGRNRTIFNILKASILCKHEELERDQYAAKVLTAIKTEFHSRSVRV